MTMKITILKILFSHMTFASKIFLTLLIQNYISPGTLLSILSEVLAAYNDHILIILTFIYL